MEQDSLQHDMMLPGVPVGLVLLGAGLLLALWVHGHLRSRADTPLRRLGVFLWCALVGFGALAAIAEAAQRLVTFATNWPVWPLAVAGAVLVEVVLLLYALERQTVSRRTGLALAALRIAIVLAVLAMLCQPIVVLETARRIERRVALLLDVSGSMQVRDNGMTPGEKLRLAEALDVPGARRACRIEKSAARLRGVQQDLAAQVDWLTSLAGTDATSRTRELEKRSSAVGRALSVASKSVAAESDALKEAGGMPLLKTNPVAGVVAQLQTRLAGEVDTPLKEAMRTAAEMGRRNNTNRVALADSLLDGLRRVSAALGDMDPKLMAAGDAVDEACYRGLTLDQRRAVDDAADVTRAELARELLVHTPGTNSASLLRPASLLDRLQKNYGVRVYAFGAQPSEISPGRLAEGPATNAETGAASAIGRSTDLAAAMEKALSDVPAEQLAAVVVMTDGRHNAANAVEPVARKLGFQQSPVYPIVMGGGRQPPTDAAIAGVDAPDTVFTNDKVLINVDLKLDGLAGTNVAVRLLDGDTVVATNAVAVGVPTLRKRIQLGDVPKTNGLHVYRISLQTFPSEVNTNNNDFSVPVYVTADQTKLLLIDDVPRWEFRYLKNLFVSRDTSVKLQYLLFHPDQIDKMPPKAAHAASVTGAVEEAEATALPENEAEWMKFDIVVLGDVAPRDLGADGMKILHKFVADRGGTLVAIAGPQHMPHAYGNTPIAEMLPVLFTPADRALLSGPEPQYRIAVTREGREHVLMKLSENPAENMELWNGLPDIYWRHVVLDTKEGASVLAYAMPPETPGVLGAEPPGNAGDETAAARRRQYERENALIAVQHLALGKVLFLGFDHTWRLRYRRGDLLHHRFWGQVIRWATDNKLPGGSGPVRIGTDRPRYTPDAPIRVRARLVHPDFTPVTDAKVAVTVSTGERRVLRKTMQFQPDSPGLYFADIGSLPEGRYRAALDPDALGSLIAAPSEAPSVEFAVTGEVPAETVELAADRGLLTRLAGLTGGKVFDPPDIAAMPDLFGPPIVVLKERRQIDLWNCWPFLLLIILLATAEWALRKKVRLP